MPDIGPGLSRDWCANLIATLSNIPVENDEERLRQFASSYLDAQRFGRFGGSLNLAVQLASREELNTLLAALQAEPVPLKTKKIVATCGAVQRNEIS